MKEILAFPPCQFTVRHLNDDLVHCGDLKSLVATAGSRWHDIKDIGRTYVAEAVIDNRHYIVKIPRARDSRLWERFMTLFRGSDVTRFADSLQQMQSVGFCCPQPVMLGERRRFGMVTHSFIVYRKLEGRVATSEAEVQQVCHTLQRLHRLGYLRRDALLRNFVITPEHQVGFIDFRLSKPRLLARGRMGLECDKLISSEPRAAGFIDQSYKNSSEYRLANAFLTLRLAIKGLKQRIRGY